MGMSKAIKKALAESGFIKVVRCKNCYWWTRHILSNDGTCHFYGFNPPSEFYCGSGETKKQVEERIN